MSTFRIDHYDRNYPQLEIILDSGRRVSFSVRDVALESREWLGRVLVRQFDEEIAYAVAKEKAALQKSLRGLLGINDGMNRLGF